MLHREFGSQSDYKDIGQVEATTFSTHCCLSPLQANERLKAPIELRGYQIQ